MSRDRDGNFHLLGRADLFIKTASTERVHPEEVEAVLEAHPDVLEAAVCGRADADKTERLVALVVLRAADKAPAAFDVQLARFVGDQLGSARRPGEIVFVECLPRLASGKLARAALLDLLI
jgi:acetyl-CoA synthetase